MKRFIQVSIEGLGELMPSKSPNSNEDIQTARARELTIWDVELQTLPSHKSDLELKHGTLRAHADTLYRLGLIDAGEMQERRELVDAAFSVVVEDSSCSRLNWTAIGSAFFLSLKS